MKVLTKNERDNFDYVYLKNFIERIVSYLEVDFSGDKELLANFEDIFCEAVSIAFYFSKKGFKVFVYSGDLINEKKISEGFVNYYDKDSFERFIQDFEDCRRFGAEFLKIDFDVKKILESVDFILIFLFDSILEIEGFKAKRFAVVKVDEDFVYFINPMINDSREFLRIRRKEFESFLEIHKDNLDIISI